MFTVVNGQVTAHDMLLTPGTAAMYGRVTCGGPQGCSPPANILVLQFCGLGSTGSSNPCALYSTSTRPDGTWDTPSNSLVGGNYTVHVFAPPGWDNAARFNIAVSNYQARGPINIDLAQNGSNSGQLKGHVSDAAGASYPNCRVNVFDQQAQPAGSYRGQGFLTGTPTGGASASPAPRRRWVCMGITPGRGCYDRHSGCFSGSQWPSSFELATHLSTKFMPSTPSLTLG